MDIRLNREFNYDKINEDGIIEENVHVSDNDVIIGKYSKIDGNVIDSSNAIKDGAGGIVDKVFCDFSNTNKNRICKVRVCSERIPMIGDKFVQTWTKGSNGNVVSSRRYAFYKKWYCTRLDY